ncbi:MAG: phage holin family protein [Polyangiaceae bacterium]|jgi:hypothetical protein
MIAEAKEELGVGQLLGTLGRETGILVRQEVQLASSELAAKGSQVARAAGIAAAGGALLHAGILAVMAAVVFALGLVIPAWVGALVLGLAVSGSGYAVLQAGLRALKRIDPLPQEALKVLHTDRRWAKEPSR